MTDTVPRPQRMAPPGATTGQDDLLEAAGHPIGTGVIKSGYHPRLTNEDLAPLRRPAQV